MSDRTKHSAALLLLISSAAALVIFSPDAVDQPVVRWTALGTACASLVGVVSVRRSRQRRE
ncbi:hypothetical protein [Streptomyces gobitricini]|uniref:hypothetical protein n=1 Tax=Streptomyces gobitricini TaxID=68211 RepID=UPI0031DB3B51